jgi:Holliday junction resolvase RusA-like endonuclease
MSKHKFTIKGSLPDFNSFAPANWRKFARIKKKATEKVAEAAKDLPKFTHPIFLKISYYPKDKRKDKDNIAASKKFILDGLIKAGKIPNDGWGEIDCWIEEFEVDKSNPRIEIEITEEG